MSGQEENQSWQAEQESQKEKYGNPKTRQQNIMHLACSHLKALILMTRLFQFSSKELGKSRFAAVLGNSRNLLDASEAIAGGLVAEVRSSLSYFVFMNC